jgi:predicted ribosome quality control (RQC) complex YloA/Tae2 family protein
LTISFIFTDFTYMKKQRLSVIDLNIAAIELRNLFANQIINGIGSSEQRITFETDNGRFAFVIVSGNPYIVLDNKPLSGPTRFRNLLGGKLENFAQVNFDRILCVDLITFNKLGTRKKQKLYFELYGNGNIILTDESNIIRELFRVTTNKQTGQEFVLPEISQSNPLVYVRDKSWPSDLATQVNKMNLFPYHQIDKDDQKLAELMEQAINHPEPFLLNDFDGNPSGFTLSGPPFIDGISGIKKDSFLEAITQYVDSFNNVSAAHHSVENPLAGLKKAQAKLKAIQDEIAQTENAGLYRQYGDIILSHLGEIKKGLKTFRCANPYSESGEFVEIPLSVSLTPEKNAADYFDKARRMESSVAVLKQRLSNQLHKVEQLQQRIDTPEPINPETQSRSREREKPPVKLPFRQVDLADGWRVYIGKSAEANDELTFSFAKKDDLWFHAWQAAGSHVVLRRPNKGDIPPKEILLRAAELAAYNSKAKTSGKVPVIFTEIRYVRKVRGAAGKVTVTNEKQVMVKPTPPEKIIGE